MAYSVVKDAGQIAKVWHGGKWKILISGPPVLRSCLGISRDNMPATLTATISGDLVGECARYEGVWVFSKLAIPAFSVYQYYNVIENVSIAILCNGSRWQLDCNATTSPGSYFPGLGFWKRNNYTNQPPLGDWTPSEAGGLVEGDCFTPLNYADYSVQCTLS